MKKETDDSVKKGLSFQQMILENLDIHVQKNKFWSICHIVYKINLKWIIEFNVKPKTIKLPKETY